MTDSPGGVVVRRRPGFAAPASRATSQEGLPVMFLAFLRLVRSLWTTRGTLLPARRPRLTPGVEALEGRWLPSTIGGIVYFDGNNDGIHQPNEPGIANNTIQLFDASGNLLATTTTDSTGHYLFATNPTVAPTPGTQEVDAAFNLGRTNTSQTQSVAQFNPALGTLKSVEIIENGTLTSNIKVENDDNAPATITGTVNGTLAVRAGGLNPVQASATNTNSAAFAAWDGADDFAGPSGKDFGSQSSPATGDVTFDAKSNDLSAFLGTGTVSLTETAQATSSVTGAGNLMAAVKTQASAQVRVIYHYESGAPLAPGAYTVVQPNDPPGYVHGLETSDNVTPIPGSDQMNSIPVQLTNGGSPNNNFGERKLSSLTGTVYLDANRDGHFDAGDRPLSGVALTLTGTDDLGEQVNGTTQTAADGSYRFNGLRPGNYVISETQPAGYLQGTNTVGSLGGAVSGDNITVSVPWSVSGTGYNFGELQPTVAPPGVNVLPPPSTSFPGTPEPVLTKRDFIGGAWTKWGW